MSLLELINLYYCGRAQTSSPADWLAFGLFMADADSRVYNVGNMQSFVEARQAILRSGSFRSGSTGGQVTVFGEAYVNDAFLGSVYTDGDKMQRVVFPGYGIRVSSHSLSEDWRYLILAVASGIDTSQPAILEVVYEDKVVRGFVKAEVWEALDELHLRLKASTRLATPGLLCERCSLTASCAPFQAQLSEMDLPDASVTDRRQRAHKLWLVATTIRSRIKVFEEAWKVVSKKLKECIEEGRISINDYFYLDAEATERSSYPFGPTYSILQESKQWKPEFGRVMAGELNKAIPSMPPEVQERLSKLKQIDSTEPSLREVVHNGQQSIKASIFAGVSGKK